MIQVSNIKRFKFLKVGSKCLRLGNRLLTKLWIIYRIIIVIQVLTVTH